MNNKIKKLEVVIAGVDAGNTSVKLNFGDEQTANYENIFVRRDKTNIEKDYQKQKNSDANIYNISKKLDVAVTMDLKDKNDKVEFIFGDKSIAYRKSMTERKNGTKSDDKQLVMNSLVALANEIVKQNKDFWEENIEFDVDVIIGTGLPFKEHKIANKMENYKNLFIGNHKIEFLDPSYPVKAVSLNVIDTYVEIEGFSALRQTLFDKKVMQRGEDLEQKICIMVDFGCYTVDIAGGIFYSDITDEGKEYIKFVPVDELSYGTDYGVGTAIDKTIDILEEENIDVLGYHGALYRKDVIEASKKDETQRLIKGNGINIDPFYTEECEKIGLDVAELLFDLIDNNKFYGNVLEIYISGGGANIDSMVDRFKNYLIEEKHFNENLFTVVEKPVFANGKGYFNIANANYRIKLRQQKEKK